LILLKLIIKNINSFKGEQIIDFESKELKESIFLITGKTGSGKSTILDSIFIALYNKTPRNANPEHTINQSSKSGRVELLYIHRGKNYRHIVELKQGIKKAYVYQDSEVLVDGKVRGLETVTESIIGLSFDSFLRTVILSQNEFVAFLRSNTAKQRELIESVTGIGKRLNNIKIEVSRLYGERRDDFLKLESEVNSIKESLNSIDLENLKRVEESAKSKLLEIDKRSIDVTKELLFQRELEQKVNQVENLQKELFSVEERVERAKDLLLKEEILLVNSEKELQHIEVKRASFSDIYSKKWLLDELKMRSDEVRRLELDRNRTEKSLNLIQQEKSRYEIEIKNRREEYIKTHKLLNGETEESLSVREAHFYEAKTLRKQQLSLIDGEPCPVCGSKEHINKPMTDSELDKEEDLIKSHKELIKRLHTLERDGKELKTTISRENQREESERKVLIEQNTLIEQKSRELQNFKDENRAIFEKLGNTSSHLIEKEKQSLDSEFNRLQRSYRDIELKIERLKTTKENSINRIKELSAQISNLNFDDSKFNRAYLKELQDEEQELKREDRRVHQELGEIQQRESTYLERKSKLKELEKIFKDSEKSYEEIAELNSLQKDNRFRDYVLNFYMENITKVANSYLNEMSEGRYEIVVGAKKNELSIKDYLNQSSERGVETLSGGETFIVSLSLSLALSQISSGGNSIGFMFIDEGFGSLDNETLQTVMKMIYNLQKIGKSIGIVSHISELKELIEGKIVVIKSGDGTSKITI